MRATGWCVLSLLWSARLVRLPAEGWTRAGHLLGEITHDGTLKRYFAVPYAVVTERFQDSEEILEWAGAVNALDENVKCSQRFTNFFVIGKEDCLTLNIYTPATVNELLPVMVFFHGGGFRDGSNSPFLYGPEYLVKHGVVLVTVNYRLEILGFLCLGIKEAPGNVGLKDQVLALKWIKRNIKELGGDPDNVAIFGESAGSASVLYHILSPLSAGLFHKAIMQSGSAMSPWSLQFEPLDIASALIKQMGYNTTDPHKIYDILSQKNVKELLTTRVPRKKGDVVLSENIFVPCVDAKIPGVEQFLPDTPYNLLLKGQYSKVPVIIGYNSAEGYLFVGKENDTTIKNLNFFDSIPRDLVFPSEKEKLEIAKALQRAYMGDEDISKDTLVRFSRYEGETGITYPVIATIDLMLITNDKAMFGYRFDYDGWMNLAKWTYGYAGSPGATHADDIFYLFKLRAPLPLTVLEKDMIEKMTSLWTNFAKYSDPTPEVSSTLPTKWQRLDLADPKILVIDKQFSSIPLWGSDTLLLLNNIYSKYRRKNA